MVVQCLSFPSVSGECSPPVVASSEIANQEFNKTCWISISVQIMYDQSQARGIFKQGSEPVVDAKCEKAKQGPGSIFFVVCTSNSWPFLIWDIWKV